MSSLNERIARAKGLKVEVVAEAWSDEDWLCSNWPTARDVPAIINEEFELGSLQPPAWVLPDWSGSIADAWALVEELRAMGKTITLEIRPEHAGAFVDGHDTAGNMCEAIAAAWLAVMEDKSWT